MLDALFVPFSFSDMMLESKERWVARLRVMVGAYIGGPEMLKYRLALDIWNRLVRLISHMNEIVIPTKIAKEIKHKYKSNGLKKIAIEDVRQRLGITRAQIHPDQLMGLVKPSTPGI